MWKVAVIGCWFLSLSYLRKLPSKSYLGRSKKGWGSMRIRFESAHGGGIWVGIGTLCCHLNLDHKGRIVANRTRMVGLIMLMFFRWCQS